MGNLKKLWNKIPKKFRKKICWLPLSLLPAVILLALLLHKPAGYQKPQPERYKNQKTELSQKLTNQLIPNFYNQIQYDKPFDLAIDENSLNELITHHPHVSGRYSWPIHTPEITIHKPKVTLSKDTVTLTALVEKDGFKIVLTLRAKPKINKNNMLNLNISAVKIGALNITPIASLIAKHMFKKRIENEYLNPNEMNTKIIAAILVNKPFAPALEVKDRLVRLEKITITKNSLSLRLNPSPD